VILSAVLSTAGPLWLSSGALLNSWQPNDLQVYKSTGLQVYMFRVRTCSPNVALQDSSSIPICLSLTKDNKVVLQ
jgi:hypothetical protein